MLLYQNFGELVIHLSKHYNKIKRGWLLWNQHEIFYISIITFYFLSYLFIYFGIDYVYQASSLWLWVSAYIIVGSYGNTAGSFKIITIFMYQFVCNCFFEWCIFVNCSVGIHFLDYTLFRQLAMFFSVANVHWPGSQRGWRGKLQLLLVALSFCCVDNVHWLRANMLVCMPP